MTHLRHRQPYPQLVVDVGEDLALPADGAVVLEAHERAHEVLGPLQDPGRLDRVLQPLAAVALVLVLPVEPLLFKVVVHQGLHGQLLLLALFRLGPDLRFTNSLWDKILVVPYALRPGLG